jgi:hypothetical protein
VLTVQLFPQFEVAVVLHDAASAVPDVARGITTEAPKISAATSAVRNLNMARNITSFAIVVAK